MLIKMTRVVPFEDLNWMDVERYLKQGQLPRAQAEGFIPSTSEIQPSYRFCTSQRGS